ncbi:protein NLRC3-like [Dysidea avara]|uniref:protein NLRC3-like n=1 Tax=Dysidea avara TaxID=196820 RepID=UPI003316EFE6
MCIKRRSEINGDDWPPYQPETYTTVVLIHHKEKIAYKKAVIAVAKKAYKGEVMSSCTNGSNNDVKPLSSRIKNSYLSSCKYIRNIYDIFPGSKPYTVLIEGAPGIGKTILTKEIAFLWADGKILEDTKLLVSIYLRDPCVHQILTFTDLAKYITTTCHQNKMIEDFTLALSNTCGKDITFVFDGYDELPESFRKESFIANIINRKMFPLSNLIITSRPSASAHLHKMADCRIEILGFTDDDRRMYISRALKNDLEKVEKILSYLDDNPIINSLCYIPLNMSIFICLLKELAPNELPKNQTEINKQFICMTISRYILREEKNKVERCLLREEKNKVESFSLDNMPMEYRRQFKELSELAFDLLGKDKIVFNHTDVKENSQLFSKDLNGMGLLKAVKHFSFTDNCEQVSFNFLHFSLQEFLAAYHIASSTDAVQKRIMHEKFWCERYLNTWIMYFGLTKGNYPPLIHFLSGNRFLWLTKLKFKVEALSQRLIDQVNLDTLQLINCNIPSSVELSQLGRIISSSKRQWKCIDISGCNIEDRGCATLSRMCKEYTKIDDVTVKVLNLTNNGLTMSSLKDISSIVLLWKVEKVVISCNGIRQYDLSHAISAMAKHEIFKQYLFQIEVGTVYKSIIIHNHSNCKQYLSKMLTFEKAMFGKMISNNLIDSQQILRSSTIEPPPLESYNTSSIALPDIRQGNLNVINTVTVGMHDTQSYFSLRKGIIPYRDFLYVTQEVKFIAPIQHIHVVDSIITTEIACQISETISSGKQLESIELVSNNVEEQDIIKIVTALQCTSTLLYLCVSDNVVSNVTAQTFASAISCNIDLEHFHLSHCELREQGMLTIIKSLRLVKSLKHCNLSGNYITDKCATALASIITNNSMLSHLNLSNCKMQENGLFCIVDALEKSSTLTYLDLSSNKINNESAVLISNVIDKNDKLSHVDFSRCMLKEKGLIEVSKSLLKLPSLNYIDLSFNEISDHVAQNLAPAFKHASHVFLNICNLQRQGIEKISSVLEMASSVKELGLSETFLTSPVIKKLAMALTRNIKLNHLSIAACGLKEDDFQPILQATEISSSIKYLDISCNAFDGVTSRSLGKRILRHKALQNLKMFNCSFKEDGLKYIFKALQFNKKNFYFLDTSCNHISNDAALQLALTITSNHTLKHLILHHCDLQEQGFVAISNALRNIGCLRTLNLNYNKTSDNVAYELSGAITLNCIFSHLEMVSCNLTDLGVTIIANSLAKISSLTHLNISYNSIYDTAANKLATALLCNTSLQHLDLSYCNLDENGFCIICKALLVTSTLRYLNLSDNKISNSVAEVLTVALNKISTLNYLIVCNCDIQELGFDLLLGTLCCKNVLHHLNVNCNIVSDQTAAKICEVTAASTFLTELEIGSCNISGHGFRLIAESLMKDNKISLEHINMGCNTILFNAAESISIMFHANKSLEYLDLSGCKLGEREFITICKSLSNNVLLMHFNVSCNIITSEVATEIASIINGNKTLQYVNFHNCSLRDDGIRCIVDALCNVKTLRAFIASYNPAISNDSAKYAASVITNNTFLEHFDLSNCNLQEASTSVISQAAKNISTLKCLILD